MNKQTSVLIAISIVIICMHISPVFAENGYLSSDDFLSSKYRGFTLDGKRFLRTDTDMKNLGEIGANIARIGVKLSRCKGCTEYTLRKESVAYLDWVISMGEKNSYKIVITMVPENPHGAKFWKDKNLQQGIIDTWIKLAKKYKTNTTVAGYDLINEPKPQGKTWQASSRWVAFANRIIEAIRAVDTNHIIFFEPAPSASAYGFKALEGLLPYPNIVYSLHLYEPVSVTHQGVYDKKIGIKYPTENLNKHHLLTYLDPVIQFQEKYKVPIYVGEFGIVRWAPGDTSYNWINDVVDIFNRVGWSWTYHSYRGWHGWDHELPLHITDKPKNLEQASKLRETTNNPSYQLIIKQLKKKVQ